MPRSIFVKYLFVISLFLIILISSVIGSNTRHDPLIYLLFLSILCSTPFLLTKELNGPYCILIIFSPLYFIYYGVTDLLRYYYRIPSYEATDGIQLTITETGILLGWIFLMLGYYLAVKIFNTKDKKRPKDWSTKYLTYMGIICSLIGLFSLWKLQMGFADHYAIRKTTLSPTQGIFLIGGKMLEPVGAVLIVYAYLREKSKFLFMLFFSICILKIPLAFILDSKEIALQNLIIFFAAKWLFDAKVPIKWIILFFATISLLFPLFYAYRSVVFSSSGQTREQAFQNLSKNFNKAFSASEKSTKEGKLQSGIISFTSRINLKPTFMTVVTRTGHDVPFQNGYTLSLLFYALIPRIILPDKPDSSTGQLFNRQYRISADPDTYISSSFLGELYWNFGWTGLVCGMLIIGFSFGLVGAKFNIKSSKSVTKLLVLIVTIYLLCFRFEAGIAIQYTQWIRALLIIFILHKLFSKNKTQSRITDNSSIYTNTFIRHKNEF